MAHNGVAPGNATRMHLHGECTNPVEIALRGLPDETSHKLGLMTDGVSVAFMFGPCRKCAPCLDARKRLWTARAINEIQVSERTWFATLTLHPSAAMEFRSKGERDLIQRGFSPAEMRPDKLRFRAFANALGPELQLWLKRVRKNSGARIRYFMVCEAHKSGVPHFHALIHERDGQATKRTLEAGWRLGFSQFRLIDRSSKKEARYVSKYLSKSALTRIRASRHYGEVEASTLADLIEEIALVATKVRRKTATSGIYAVQIEDDEKEKVSSFLSNKVSELS
nr:MAG: replication initiator protein [Microvirus sp.]